MLPTMRLMTSSRRLPRDQFRSDVLDTRNNTERCTSFPNVVSTTTGTHSVVEVQIEDGFYGQIGDILVLFTNRSVSERLFTVDGRLYDMGVLLNELKDFCGASCNDKLGLMAFFIKCSSWCGTVAPKTI
jgi:hypothetical protein